MEILEENNLIINNFNMVRETQKTAEILWNLTRYFYDNNHIYTRSYYGLTPNDIVYIKLDYNNLLEASKVLVDYLNCRLVASDRYCKVSTAYHSSIEDYQTLFDMCIKLESLVNIKKFLNYCYYNCKFKIKEDVDTELEFKKIISNILQKLIGYTKYKSEEELKNKISFTGFYIDYIETNLKTFGYWPRSTENQTFAKLSRKTKKDMLATSIRFNIAFNALHRLFTSKNKELIAMPKDFCVGCNMPIKNEVQYTSNRYKRYLSKVG